MNVHIYHLYLINVNNMSYMFYKCLSLNKSKWKNINDINDAYSSLSVFPDISKWNTNNVYYMNYMFYGCSSLSSIHDISKWNTSNVIDISYMFSSCSSLSYLICFAHAHHYHLCLIFQIGILIM